MIHHTNPLDLPQTLSTVVVFVYEVLYCHEYTTVELRRHIHTARKTIRPLQLGVCLAKARNSTPESGVLGFSCSGRSHPFPRLNVVISNWIFSHRCAIDSGLGLYDRPALCVFPRHDGKPSERHSLLIVCDHHNRRAQVQKRPADTGQK